MYGDVVVVPFVLTGGTDAAHFDDGILARDVYRFIPMRLKQADLPRIHGVDERIAQTSYLAIVQFYIRLLGNVAGPVDTPSNR